MHLDPRGGSNRKKIDTDFFKSWNPKMSYMIGLISADGAVEDVRKSSRTCYFTITSKDKSIIINSKKALNSSHKIYIQKPSYQKFRNGLFYCSQKYVLRIGSKEMCQDLINLGITPKKSLRLTIPKVPNNLFGFYLRGYFDGDGCINLETSKGGGKGKISVIFTSGCKDYLEKISLKIRKAIGLRNNKVYLNSGAYRLKYRKLDGLKLLKFMYYRLNSSSYLNRKYQIYTNYLNSVNCSKMK